MKSKGNYPQPLPLPDGFYTLLLLQFRQSLEPPASCMPDGRALGPEMCGLCADEQHRLATAEETMTKQ